MDKEKDEGFEFLDDFNDDVWDEERWEWFLQDMEEDEESYPQDIEDGYSGEERDGNGSENIGEEEYIDKTEPKEPWKSKHEDRWQEKESWEWDKKLHGFKRIDAYIISYQFGLAVDSYFKKFYQKVDIPEVKTILSSCFVAAKKIAMGHKIGYDRDTVTGNIVSCKQGLKAIEKCIAALKKIQIKSIRKTGIILLLNLGLRTRDAVKEWIEDLQHRIWW
jgi:hypothetical protein